MNLKDNMMLYGVTLGARRTKKQKYLFMETFKETFSSLGYRVSSESVKAPGSAIEYLVAGDLDHADTIFMTALDTPQQYLTPIRYYPFHAELSEKAEKNKVILRTVLAALCVILMYYPVTRMVKNGITFVYMACTLIFAACALWLYLGTANKINFNRFSASIALMVQMAEDLKGENTAFVFADRASSGYAGFRAVFKDRTPKGDLIILGALADGETLVTACRDNHIVFAENFNRRMKEDHSLVKRYDEENAEHNLLGVLPKAVYISLGEIENGEFVIHNTCSRNDTKVDMKRLERIRTALVQTVKEKTL